MKLALDARGTGERLTFESYARSWVENYVGRTSLGLTASTRVSYARSLEHYAIPFFRGRLLAGIMPVDVRAFIAMLEDRRQALGSIRKNVAPFKCLMATAYEDGLITVDPARNIRVNTRFPQQLPQPARPMTRKQLESLLAELPPKHRLFFVFLAHTGVRISEAVGLQWHDVTLTDPAHVWIRRSLYRGQLLGLKTPASRRSIPLSPGMVTALSEYAQRQDHASGASPVFTNSVGRPFCCRSLRKNVLVPAVKRAGVGKVGYHTFRHTCASILFEGGKTARQVAAWLGHADASYTLRVYVHLLDDGLGSAAFLDREVGLWWTSTASPAYSAEDWNARRRSR
jgi:integrase